MVIVIYSIVGMVLHCCLGKHCWVAFNCSYQQVVSLQCQSRQLPSATNTIRTLQFVVFVCTMYNTSSVQTFKLELFMKYVFRNIINDIINIKLPVNYRYNHVEGEEKFSWSLCNKLPYSVGSTATIYFVTIVIIWSEIWNRCAAVHSC